MDLIFFIALINPNIRDLVIANQLFFLIINLFKNYNNTKSDFFKNVKHSKKSRFKAKACLFKKYKYR